MTRGNSGRSATRPAGVPRSTFIMRIKLSPPSERAICRLLLNDAVGKVHTDSRGTYGYRRVRTALRTPSRLIVNHKLVASVMQKLQPRGLPKRGTRRRNLIAVCTVSALVNRNFAVTGPNQLWVTDITEHPTKDGLRFCVPCSRCDATTRSSGITPNRLPKRISPTATTRSSRPPSRTSSTGRWLTRPPDSSPRTTPGRSARR